jgi:cytochrome b subunit of formate dehydrogenase
MNTDSHDRARRPMPRFIGTRPILALAFLSLLATLAFSAQTLRSPAQPTGARISQNAGSAAGELVRDPNRRCMQCHGQAQIATLGPEERRSMVGTWLDPDQLPGDLTGQAPLRGDEAAVRPGLYVDLAVLASSPHAGVTCVECHEDSARLPHAPTLNRATCATTCHSSERQRFDHSAHGEALARGDPLAPSCCSCHGGHDILRVSERSAKPHRLNSLHLCGDCHKQHGPAADSETGVGTYMGSVHARAVARSGLLWAATCSDCHDPHGVLPSSDPRSPVHRNHVTETCGRCHAGAVAELAQSIHGRVFAENGNGRHGPVCIDCHTGHSITRIEDPRFFADIVSECGDCHDTEVSGRLGTFYQSYHLSYHGKVTRLGGRRAARCSDCHGFHDILPLDDPRSRVHQSNLVATCGQEGCHPKANARFVQFDPHANHRDRANYPILHGVWLYFMILITTVFTFFGLHTLLWFLRSVADRLKRPREHGAGEHAVAAGHGHLPMKAPTASRRTHIRRFTTLDRINHVFVALTFFGLTATGIPLFFAGKAWARPLADLVGGVEAAGVWHRFFAILLIINLALHFMGLGRRFIRHVASGGSWHRWIFGPNSLVPRWKDVTDCIGMFRWFLGLGPRPRFDRWTYWEKFDYWAEIGGSFIIGGSGLLLWFPEYASLILPGWIFNVAAIVHGFEALLAIGFIFTIHFFNAHLRPETFPVDEVIFTGSMTEEEFMHHRPAEYERLVQTGQLEALRVPSPDPARRPWIILIAVLSVGFGLTLLALIVLGGLGVF